VGLVCVSPVFAQDTLTVAADTLVVSATRTERPVLDVPFAVDVLTLKDLPRAEAGLSLAEKLRYVPGLVVDNRQNLSQGDRITMRGVGARASFGVRGIRLVLDGIPLTMPDGQAQLNNLDLVDIERVEVLRGPSAALYGNASGGVILLHSGGGQGEPFSMRPSVVVGSDGLRREPGPGACVADDARTELRPRPNHCSPGFPTGLRVAREVPQPRRHGARRDDDALGSGVDPDRQLRRPIGADPLPGRQLRDPLAT